MKVPKSCPTLRPHGLYSPWNSPGQNAGVGSLSLLQGIFPTQGSNPGLPRCRRILYQLSHKGSPSILGRILSLLQRIFPTQESNQGILHYRQILYQLSYRGSPTIESAAAAKSLQSCPTLWPHRRQPTRLPHPWDSPGKNTVVGCHFLLQCMKVKSKSKVSQSCPTLSYPTDCSLPGSSVHGIFQARVLEWVASAFSVRTV